MINKDGLRCFKTKLVLLREYIQDMETYRRNALLAGMENSQENLIGIVMFRTHSIEKGLSHETFRPEFGKDTTLKSLFAELTQYREFGFDESDSVIKNAVSVLNEYLDKHKQLNMDIPWFSEMFEGWLYPMNSIAGVKKIQFVKSNDFAELAANRNSIREFGSDPVTLESLQKAVHISMKTPSVCNRQPWKVKIITDMSLIQKILDIQGGFNGYKVPNKLLLITVDAAYFNGLGERNEPYIDGGLFTMSLLYALESLEIAAVALNAMFTSDKTKDVRELLDINSGEVLITFIAVGSFPKSTQVPKSFRKDYKEIITVY